MRAGPVAICTIILAGCHAPGPWRQTDAVAPVGTLAPFLAGAAAVEFTPEAGYPLGGYGGGERREEWPFYFGVGWPGQLALAAHQAWHEDDEDPDARHDLLVGATGTHDPLLARALVLRPRGGTPAAIVRIDAIAVTSELHDLLVRGVADLGYRPGTVLLCATHTHSGAGAFMRTPLARIAGTDNFRPEVEARIAKACIEAVRRAHAAARPAALGVGVTLDRGPPGPDGARPTLIGRNRRARNFEGIADDAIDDEIAVLRVDDAATGEVLAAVVAYAVHPTVLGTSNHEFSADLAGGIERAVSRRLGGAPALFLNGAEGDVGPRRPDPDPGHPFARCDALGERMADLVAPVVSSIVTTPTIRVAGAVGETEMGWARTVVGAGREALIDGGPASWLATPLLLPVDVLLWALGATHVWLEASWALGIGLGVHLGPYVDRTVTRVGALRIDTPTEVIALLAVPGEPTHDVGLALEARARARGVTRPIVVGLALDHVGYIASETEYRRGGYEAMATFFGPGTAAHLAEASGRALDAVGLPATR